MFCKRRRSINLLGVFVLLLLSFSGKAGAEDLSNWPYRITVAIGNAPTNETYPTQEITNAAFNAYIDTASLISQGLMRADCGDIRVADGNGSLLRFSVSACSSASTTFHFQIPQVAGSNSMEVYIYHGNLAAASAAENPSNFSSWMQAGVQVLAIDDFNGSWRKCASPDATCLNSDPLSGTTGELINVYNISPGPYTNVGAKKLFYARAGSYEVTLRHNPGETNGEFRVYNAFTGSLLFQQSWSAGSYPNNTIGPLTVTIPADGPTVWVYRVWSGYYVPPTYLENVSNLSSLTTIVIAPAPAAVLRPYTQYFPSFTANWKKTTCFWSDSACIANNVAPATSNYVYDESSLATANVNDSSYYSEWGFRKHFDLAAGVYEYCMNGHSTTFTTRIFDNAGNVLDSISVGDYEGCHTFTVPGNMTVLWTARKSLGNYAHARYTSFKRVGDPGPASLPEMSLFSCPMETYPGAVNSCTVEGTTADGALVHYKWIVEGGDPGVMTGASANVKFVSPGMKTVRVKMWRDDLGETYATYTSATINVRSPITDLTLDCPHSASVNEEIICTASLSAAQGVTYSYSWQTGGQITQNNGANIRVKFTGTGEKTITIKAEQAGYPGVFMTASAMTDVKVDFSMTDITCPSLLRMGEMGHCSVNASATIGTLVYQWSASGDGVHFGSPSSSTTSFYSTQGGIKAVQVTVSLREYPEAVKTAYAVIDVSPVNISLSAVCPASAGRLESISCNATGSTDWGTLRYDWGVSPGGVIQNEQGGAASIVFLQPGTKTVTARAYIDETPTVYVERAMDVTVTVLPPTVNSATCADIVLGQKVYCSISAEATDGTVRYMWAAPGGAIDDNASPNTGILFRTAGQKTVTVSAYLEEYPSVGENIPITVNVGENVLDLEVSCPQSAATADTFTCAAESTATWGTPILTWNADSGTATASGNIAYVRANKEGALPVRVTMSLAEADWLTKAASTLVKVAGASEITPKISGPKAVYVHTENTYEAQAPCVSEGSCTVRWRAGEIEHDGPTLAVTFPVEGKYALQAETSLTGTTLTKATELTVYAEKLPRPIVTIKGPGAVFVGQATTYRMEVAEKHKNLGVTGRWVLPDGSSAEGTEVTITPAAGGYQELGYKAWIDGEKDTTTRLTKKRINCVAYVFPLPKIGLKSIEGLAPYRVTFKTEDTVKRVSGAEYRITYDWSFGDGETVTTDNTIVGHTFVRSGSYNVTMTATDQYGNTSTDTKTITAGVPPVEIGLKVSASNKATRVPVDVYVRSTTTKRSTLDRLEAHEWAIDDVVVEETQPGWVKATFTEPGTHTITYTATMKSGAVGTQSATVTVSPNQPPVCDMDYADNASTKYVYLKARCIDADGRMSGYKWDLDDGRGLRNGSVNISFKAPETKTYNVTLVGIDDAGGTCEFVKTVPITR